MIAVQLRRGVALGIASLLVAQASVAADIRLNLLGATSIPTGTRFAGVEFGGISGIDRAADGNYYAISDDRGGERGTPRFYSLALDYDETGFHGVSILSQTFMQRPDGSPFPSTSRTVDPEGIRVAGNGNLYWSSEGNYNNSAALRFQPFVREMTTGGVFVREFDMPAMFDYVDNTMTGGRSNKLFEALAVAADGTVYVANEDALIQDGNITTLANGSRVRITALDPDTGNPTAQYAYELPPIPLDAAPGAPFGPDNGLPELLALGDGSFIALERAFAFGVGNTIRLTQASFDASTTNTLDIPSLAGAMLTPMSRELLLEMPLTFEGVTMDNFEGMSWGKNLANGNRTLVLVADNNFAANQTTLFMAFEVMQVPSPPAVSLLFAGLAGMGVLARRRVRR